MKTCLILEDEPPAQELLADYIKRIPELELIACCRHPAEAFEILLRQSVDLLFLDIQLPVINGLQFIRALKQPPSVIFVTAYPQHALESYEIDAVDYLLKPVSFERFLDSIRRFRKHTLKSDNANTYAYFKVDGKFIKLNHDEILYGQSYRDYIMLYTVSGNYMTHMTMKNLAVLLPSPPFKRVHRSYIINTNKVTAYSKQEIFLGAVKIPVGDYYKS